MFVADNMISLVPVSQQKTWFCVERRNLASLSQCHCALTDVVYPTTHSPPALTLMGLVLTQEQSKIKSHKATAVVCGQY